jgi:hypothetical protein
MALPDSGQAGADLLLEAGKRDFEHLENASRSDHAFLQSIAVRLPVAQIIAERISFKRQAELQGCAKLFNATGGTLR